MSLLEQIFDWSVSLKQCLRDALRRLLDCSTLTETDYDDLFALLKLEAGIPDANGRTPTPLEREHLPSVTTIGNTVRLLAIRNFKHVNRIAPNQEIAFEPTGLTVIYGDNGTGKSGYSRVLKLACRARGEKALVLPNAHLPKHNQGTPEAEFVFEVNGNKTTFRWNGNATEHPELASLSVFDSHCARAYIDSEQDVAYLPYGLDIVENLANIVLPELARRIRAAIADCRVELSQFAELSGETQVGVMIATLSAKTDPATIELLSTLTDEEEARLVTLRATLSEHDPKVKAAQSRRLAERLRTLSENIDAALRFVDEAAVNELRRIVTATDTAVAAEALAIEALRSGEDLLPSTGGPEWQLLFEAARKFASLAYESQEFPSQSDGAKCPLCQQDLQEGANRLKRFDTFIKDNAAKVAQAKRSELLKATTTLGDARLHFSLDQTLTEEITAHTSTLCPAIQTFQSHLEERRKWMLDSVTGRIWDNAPTPAHDPRPDLTSLIATLLEQAASFDGASDEDTRKAMQTELAELDAKAKCRKLKKQLLHALSQMTMAAKLESCLEHVKTTPITNKSKDFAQQAVTQALSDALNSEFAQLDLSHIYTKLKTRAKDGKTYHKLILDVPTACKLTDILSEGEFRVMAIASFLAELSLANHSGGAIFDDPVSSLDHFRRLKVARRLTDESKKRQIIIFTHDTVFLGELQGIVERESIPAKFYHLEWTTSEYSGYCCDGLPWHHQSYASRIDALKKEYYKLKQDWIPVPNAQLCDRMRTAYSHFRSTIERAVETEFLNGVVKRFENYVPVTKIKKVIGLLPSELKELNRLVQIAHDTINAHDPATGANRPPPTPDEFLDHINALDTLVKSFKARRDALV